MAPDTRRPKLSREKQIKEIADALKMLQSMENPNPEPEDLELYHQVYEGVVYDAFFDCTFNDVVVRGLLAAKKLSTGSYRRALTAVQARERLNQTRNRGEKYEAVAHVATMRSLLESWSLKLGKRTFTVTRQSPDGFRLLDADKKQWALTQKADDPEVFGLALYGKRAKEWFRKVGTYKFEPVSA